MESADYTNLLLIKNTQCSRAQQS